MPAPTNNPTPLTAPFTIEEIKKQAETLLEILPEPVCLLDGQCIIHYQNTSSRNLCGDNLGKTCQAVCQQCANYCEACPSALASQDGQLRRSERVLRNTQGERYLEVTIAPITNPDGTVIAVLMLHHDVTDSKLMTKGKERLIQELQAALATAKRLSGLLSICPQCKKIRDNQGHWVPLESYIRSHAEVEFNQCPCDECTGKQPKEQEQK